MGSHLWSLARQVGHFVRSLKRTRPQILVLLEAGLPDGSRREPGSKANGKGKIAEVKEIDHSII